MHGAGLGYKSPGAVGEAIAEHLPSSALIGKVTVAAQGFVTVRLSDPWLLEQLRLVVS